MMGCNFQVHASAVAELAGGDAPEGIAVGNAGSKAMSVAARHPGIPVLGADTVVALGNQIYGKPKDPEEAEAMLRSLSGRTHQVITGIAFALDKRMMVDSEMTEVRFGAMTDKEIRDYIATGEPMDKAGAYALQGRAEAFIESIHGSWSNVVGLPLCKVRTLARKAGIDLYGDHGTGFARR